MNLYVDLSSGNVTRSGGLYEGPCILTPSLPLVGVRRLQQVILFPRLQKTDVWRLIGSPQFAFCDHPLAHQVSGTNASKLAATIAATKLLRSLALPVYSDLQFRLSWMLLPTRSRFYFLRIPGSSDLACGYPNCVEVETAHHLFLDCSRAAVLWAVVMRDWTNFVDGSVTSTMI
ncbi:hypothetical protein PHYSODRAFT_500329 [Phytophthora sojae]|uniref:Reverse transcriptase zinc-binding domain-containing protein n=1 Tax=Phytophthora sojae (strain P6497) TaxID=1094619 RepID=G4ZFY4_PHYSP|nr:hypothetical protein PHYSODRAFT_500329 [Phytophthora sojae]EGZ17051.1 hypothetical protein PHYSODRAFT_500329 [Phytophthora sojae]|eukprot:XP_009526109.1 hypothetical protein PHYSODRAFT_500329 [Phytophthora sojae]